MISTQNVSLQYGDRALFENVNIKFTSGNCYGVIGANGAGKSTFLKILSGEIEPNKGEVILEPNKRLSMLKQDHFAYEENEVLETVIMGNARLYEIMQEKEKLYAKADFNDEDGIKLAELEGEFAEMDGWNAEVDGEILLNGLGISEEYHHLKMKELEANQKVKVLLAQALFGNPDVLLLDEPTNHLDLDMRQALTEALIEFEGALVVVSHDRHLLRSTTDDLYLVHDRKVEPFDGDLEDYQQWLSDVQKQENQTDDAPKENANSAQARKDQKRREAELRAQTQPLRKEIARLEKEMEKLNAQLAQAEEKLGDSELYDQSRKAELTACLQQQASAKSGLEECEMAWLEAQEQLEQMLLEGQSN